MGALSSAMSCDVFTPHYQSIVYSSICNDMADSLIWMWLTTLTLTFSLLVMNTTRRATWDDTLDLTPEADDDEEWDEESVVTFTKNKERLSSKHGRKKRIGMRRGGRSYDMNDTATASSASESDEGGSSKSYGLSTSKDRIILNL